MIQLKLCSSQLYALVAIAKYNYQLMRSKVTNIHNNKSKYIIKLFGIKFEAGLKKLQIQNYIYHSSV